MRLEREAVTVCPRILGLEWGADCSKMELGHFAQHEQQHLHHQYRHHLSSCCPIVSHDEFEEVGSVMAIRSTEGPFFNDDLLHSPANVMANPSKLIVGYALTAKKAESFIKPPLLAHARSKGILFSKIDHHRPLQEQGPFDVILHKITGHTWHQQLKAYENINPEVFIFDSPEAIEKVYNRQSMLQEVADLNFHHPQGNVGVPKQLVVDRESPSMAKEVEKFNMNFPLVVKPLWIDGTAKSHALSLAFNEVGLSTLKTPVVLQEFVNHGGVMFKVYVVEQFVKVICRPSLPDQTTGVGVVPFPRVSSSAAASAVGVDLDPSVCEHPPEEMLSLLVRKLRLKLGLTFFNLDMIREGGKGNQYYVIDINYFPGYGKVPGYEDLFINFLVGVAARKE